MGSTRIKAISLTLLAAVLILGGFLVYITLTDYKPQEITTLTVNNNPQQVLKQGESFSVTTFNIGYAGLDKGKISLWMAEQSHAQAVGNKRRQTLIP